MPAYKGEGLKKGEWMNFLETILKWLNKERDW